MTINKKIKPKMEFPDDEDGFALKEMYERGVDFSKPYSIDFFVVVPDGEKGEKVKELAEQEGFECFVDRDDEFDEWICYCTKSMMLDYKELNDVQKFLSELSRPCGGFADGWGTFGD